MGLPWSGSTQAEPNDGLTARPPPGIEQTLLYDVDRRSLAVAGGGAGKERTEGADRLAVAANDSADIALAHLQAKDGEAAVRNFREDHFIRKLEQLADDEFEKLAHASELNEQPKRCPICREVYSAAGVSEGSLSTAGAASTGAGSGSVGTADFTAAFFAGAGFSSGFASPGTASVCALFFFNRLRTVSEACAPFEIQCSARSSLIVLFAPGSFGS